MESKSKHLKKVFKLVIKEIKVYFNPKRKYIFLTAISLFILCFLSLLVYIFIWPNTYLAIISMALLLVIELIGIIIMIEPPITDSFNYRNIGNNLLINNDINAFDIDYYQTFKNIETFQKAALIKDNLLELSKENRENLYYYFVSKQEANKTNISIQQIVIPFLTILLSAIALYYKDNIGTWIIMLVSSFAIIFIFYTNYFVGNKKRNHTEHFIINVLKDSLKDTK